MIIISLRELNEEIVKAINKKNMPVELRLDLIYEEVLSSNDFDISSISTLASLRQNIKVPLIATLRRENAGGRYTHTEEKRFEALKIFLSISFDYVDIEYDSPSYFFEYIRNKYPKTKIISSYHNFEKTPEDNELDIVFFAMSKTSPDIYKIACFANSSIDAIRMLLFTKKKANEGHQISGLCMGEKGRITRILAPVFKSFFSYSMLEKETAEGQFNVDTLINRYGYLFLNENTSIYALLGKDISKSHSHITHNKIFSRDSFKNIYVKIPLEREELSLFFNIIKMNKNRFNGSSFKGFSVTTPYKEDVIAFVDEISKEAVAIEAINTIVQKDGKWVGHNTDGVGALDVIEKRGPVKEKKMIVIGAGGAAKAICFEAKKRGANVILLNRTKAKALTVAKKMKVKGAGLDELPYYYDKGYDIIVNASSSLDPLEEKYLLSKAIAMDVNSSPQWTLFLLKAKSQKCITIFGFEMFVYQAKKQFDLWFKK